MNARRFVFCLLITVGVPIWVASQEQEKKQTHTADQCRSDTALLQTSKTEYLPYREIIARLREMSDCAAVDTKNIDRYALTSQFLEGEAYNRLYSFITRHNLREQFLSEDEAGKR